MIENFLTSVTSFFLELGGGESWAVWVAVGFFGQAMFSTRFLIQWISSEKRRESIIPIAFWYFSIAGGATLLAYAIHRLDPVFIVGQAAGLLVYADRVPGEEHLAAMADGGLGNWGDGRFQRLGRWFKENF